MGANDETATADALPLADAGKNPATGLFERLPDWVLDTLSSEQKEAIHQAADDPTWKRSPVDIRFTIPFLGKKFFITVVSGTEKRSPKRRDQERKSLLGSIQVKDNVVTIGGLHGKIIAMKDDEVTLLIDARKDVQIKVVRSSVSHKIEKGAKKSDGTDGDELLRPDEGAK